VVRDLLFPGAMTEQPRRPHALLLTGARERDPALGPAEAQLVAALEARGFTVRVERLRRHRMGYCVGCFECWTKTPGACRVRDDGWSIGSAVLEADLLVFCGAIRFGGYEAELKKGVDRMLGLLLPFFVRRDGETHHPGRYHRYPKLLGLGVQATPDDEEARIFRELVRRNGLNLCAPASGACVIAAGEAPGPAIEAALRGLEGEAAA